MITDSEKLDEILVRLERLENLHRRKKRNSRAGLESTLEADPSKERIIQTERVFLQIVNDNDGKRRSSYKFPEYLLESADEPFIQACPLSILINQLSQRKLFRLRGPKDYSDATPRSIAKAAIEHSNLVVLTTKQAGLSLDKNTLLVASPAQVIAWGVSEEDVPRNWKGWLCEERPTDKQYLTAGGDTLIPPLPEPDEVAEVKSPKAKEEKKPEPKQESSAMKFDFVKPSVRVSFPEE